MRRAHRRPAPPRRPSRALTGVAAASMVAVLSLGCSPSDPAPSTAEEPADAERPLTDWPGNEDSPRFSPDGTQIAFDARVDGQTDIYVTDLAGSFRRLTDSPTPDRRPVWSPEERTVAFQSTRDGVAGIWTLPAAGGDPTPLFERAGMLAFSPDYAPDGRLAFTTMEPDPQLTFGVVRPWVMEADGSGARPIGQSSDAWHARWGPGGTWLYYYVGVGDEIRRVNPRTGEDESVSEGRYVGWQPAPGPADRLAFISWPGGTLWLGSVNDQPPPRRLTSAGRDGAPTISPDGGRVAFSADRTLTSLHWVDVSGQGGGTVGAGTLGAGSSPQATPDGRVVFLSEPGQPAELRMRSAEGNVTPIPTGPGTVREFALSPSGRRLALVKSSGGASGPGALYVVDLDGSNERLLVDHPRVAAPRWCGESTLVFGSFGDSAFRQLRRVQVDSGSVETITAEIGSKRPTACADDGSWISAGLSHGQSGTAVFRRTSEGWVEERHPDLVGAVLARDGSRLVYAATFAGATDLFLREADGQVVRLTNNAAIESDPRFSPDGSRVYFASGTPNRDLWLTRVDGR